MSPRSTFTVRTKPESFATTGVDSKACTVPGCSMLQLSGTVIGRVTVTTTGEEDGAATVGTTFAVACGFEQPIGISNSNKANVRNVGIAVYSLGSVGSSAFIRRKTR